MYLIKTARMLFVILCFIIAPFQLISAQTGIEKTICADINAIIAAFKTGKSGTYADYSKPLTGRDLYESKMHIQGFEKASCNTQYSIHKIESWFMGKDSNSTKQLFDKLTAVLKDCYPTYEFKSEVEENYEIAVYQEQAYRSTRILLEYYSTDNKIKLSVIRMP